jgi:hypothetical protein
MIGFCRSAKAPTGTVTTRYIRGFSPGFSGDRLAGSGDTVASGACGAHAVVHTCDAGVRVTADSAPRDAPAVI